MHFGKRLLSFLSLFVASNSAIAAEKMAKFNMTRGATDVSHSIYNLHMIIFWICVAIGIVVFGVMIYSLIVHRKSRGAVAANFHEHPILEIVWSIVPFLILLVMAVPATKVLMNMEDSSEADVTIKVTGYQWKWKYEYLNEGISFFSNLKTSQDEIHNRVKKEKWYLLDVDHPLVLPIHKKVRFLVTANDVLHSWWVPALGVKRDAVPGFIHEAWARINKTGTFRGQCAELCGVNHGFMPIVVEAVSEGDFDQWIVKQTGKKAAAKEAAAKTWTKDDLMSLGKQTYETTCSVCHQPNGAGLPPAFPTMIGSPKTIGSLNLHIDTVLHGVSGTAMQAFGEQLNDADIAAVITYERNSWGNNDKSKYGAKAGGVVQPADVMKAREKKS